MAWFSRGERAARRSELLESAIGPSTSVSGVIKSDGGLRIDGHVDGHIDVAGNVVIGAEGVVHVDTLIGRNITVGGAVTGNIECGGRLEILSTGRVVGDIVADAIMIDQGGVFQGASRMRSAMPALPAPPPAPAAVDDVIIDLGPPPGDEATETVVPAVAAAVVTPPPAPEPDPPPAPAPPAAAAPRAARPPSADDAAAVPPTARSRVAAPQAPAPAAPRRAEPVAAPRAEPVAAPAEPRRAESDFDFALDIEPVIPDTAAGSASGSVRPPAAAEPSARRGRRQGSGRRR